MFFRDLGLGLGQRRGGGGSSLLNNLTSYWKMDEVSTGAAPVTRVDSVTATANDLTDNNTTASAAGKISNAASFIAANSETLSRASNASLTTGGSDFSLSCWVNPVDLLSTQAPATKLDAAGNGEWDLVIVITTGVARLRIFNGAVSQLALNGPAITAGSYHLVVITFVNSTRVGSISVDNSAFTTGVATLAPVDTAIQFTVGALVNTTFMNGGVDEMGWWKGRAITQTEVGLLWNGGAGLTYPF